VRWLMDLYDPATELDSLLIDMGHAAIRTRNFDLLKYIVSRLTEQAKIDFQRWVLPCVLTLIPPSPSPHHPLHHTIPFTTPSPSPHHPFFFFSRIPATQRSK
jgi:hypothetical protein